MRTWLSPNANPLIFRHFYLGSEILQFIARNTRGVSMSPVPLKPTRLDEVRNHVYLQHDLNLFNFVIEINRQLREQNLELAPIDELDFSCITDGPLPIEPMPDRWTNFIDLQTAIELYTPVYQLLLTDNDFWRASNSLQLDETIGLYVAKLLGTPQTTALINNKHPLVPMSTLRAGYRLVLHGLATETQHAILVQFKRSSATACLRRGRLQILGAGPLLAAQAIVAPMKNMCTRIPVTNEMSTKRHLFGVADSCITTRFMTQ